MSDNTQALSRSNALIDITRAQFRESKSSALSFSKLLFNVFCEMVPEQQRTGLAQIRQWHDEEEEAGIIEANYKRFQRYMDGTTAIPMDLEEAWVVCLLEEYKTESVIDLCNRHGVTAVEIEREKDVAGLCELMKRFSGVLDVGSDILADDVIDGNDLPHWPALKRRGNALISAMAGFLHDVERQIKAEAGVDPKGQPGEVKITLDTRH